MFVLAVKIVSLKYERSVRLSNRIKGRGKYVNLPSVFLKKFQPDVFLQTSS